MFLSITKSPLPGDALLQRFVDSGDYTDCFVTGIDTQVALADYVEAFYTTAVFKAERLVLKWAVARPSTDREAKQLANGVIDAFAAWTVVERRENQMLLMDVRGQTCSWFMLTAEPVGSRLFFGSAVIRSEKTPTGPRMKWTYRSLLGFHRVYSRVLLWAARRRLLGSAGGSRAQAGSDD
ncbi:MAG: hypothetical protein KJO31_17945 [Gammaproteobacteria bacterium]|nr:hypothetical protein [Gammaproteobacteria bacterium]